MLKVIPTGTCRIVGPCRNLAERSKIKLVRNRSFGFLHSAAEALQQIEFQFGLTERLPDDYLELVTSDLDAGLLEAPPADGDIVLLEISARKLYRSGDAIAQANIRNRSFPKFGKLIQQPDSEIADCILRIQEIVSPAKLALVTHFNGLKVDGTVIKDRDLLVQSIKRIGKDLSIPVWDPTNMLETHSQSQMMAENGADLAHYAENFLPIVADELYKFISKV